MFLKKGWGLSSLYHYGINTKGYCTGHSAVVIGVGRLSSNKVASRAMIVFQCYGRL